MNNTFSSYRLERLHHRWDIVGLGLKKPFHF